MSIKSILESIRGARHIELILFVVLMAALGLLMLNGASKRPADKSDMELRLESLFEHIDGVGKADVVISSDSDGRPTGAVVVTSGVLEVRTRLEMQSAIQALLDIDLYRIRIIGEGGLGE